MLSLLLPGAGIFLADERKSGLRWFVGLTLFGVLAATLESLPEIPSLYAYWSASILTLMLFGLLLVRSFRAVPRLGLRAWIVFLVLAVAFNSVTWVIDRSLTHRFNVPAGSMEPIISRGDHLLIQRYAYWFAKPKRGDIVVFRTALLDHPLLPKDQFYAKRVAALPGEQLKIENGRLSVGGVPVQSPAILTRNLFAPYSSEAFNSNIVHFDVPADCYFVVGDNGTNSFDSRYYGSVPRRSIIGRATKICWPIQRTGNLQ